MGAISSGGNTYATEARAHNSSPSAVYECKIVQPDGSSLTIVAANEEEVRRSAALISRQANLVEQRDQYPEVSEDDFWQLVHEAVDRIVQLVSGHDAFDVMSMIRQYLTPGDFADWNESSLHIDETWSAAEVVALVLLGLGLPVDGNDTEKPRIVDVPEILGVASEILMLAMGRGVIHFNDIRGGANAPKDLVNMAFDLSEHEILVRGRQYGIIADEINVALLSSPQSERAFQTALGFTLDDAMAVRRAIVKALSYSREQVANQIEEIRERKTSSENDAKSIIRSILSNPGRFDCVTAQELAQIVDGLSASTIEAVLQTFSLAPDGRGSNELIDEFVKGRNPLAGLGILGSSSRGYLPLASAIAPDEIRRTCESAIKPRKKLWAAYGRRRDKAVEDLVIRTLETILGDGCTSYRNLRYRIANGATDLSAQSVVHRSQPEAEADCLLTVDGIALCVEVKAGEFRRRTREGGINQLQGDLRKTVKEAASQANRLRSLITDYQGVWLATGEWLELSEIHEIHSLVVCLDDLGPLALETTALIGADILPQVDIPWVVSVHDLLVVRDVFDRPENFIAYLRRRTSPEALSLISGVDELDVVMWFVAGGLYFLSNPVELHRKYPNSRMPTSEELREYAEQGRTFVGTFTDALDAHYYWKQGVSSQPAGIPRRNAFPVLLGRIFRAMRLNQAPGWLRSAADFDELSAESQLQWNRAIQGTIERTRSDAGFHTCCTSATGDDGEWLQIFAAGTLDSVNRAKLSAYLTAKKHQIAADRALGVLVDPEKNSQMTIWLDHPDEENPALDGLIRRKGHNSPDAETEVD